MTRSNLDFATLKSKVTIAQVLVACGLLGEFSCRGERLVGPCPLHRGDNRHAFVISRSRNLWYCFSGCRESGRSGGDLIEFVRRLLSLSYREAAEYLSELAASVPRHAEPSASHAHCLRAGYAPHAPVHSSTEPADPPWEQRPFRPFLKRLSLESDVAFLSAKGIWQETASTFEVGAYQGPGWLRDCIGVRLFDLEGRALGYAGRRLDDAESRQYGKWKFPRGLPANELLYNYQRARGQLHRGLLVVECVWGVMRLHQLGVPAVALLGVQLSEQRRALLRQASRVVLMLDGEPAGWEASRRLARALAPRVEVRVVSLPEGQDPDDLSPTELAQRLRRAVPEIELR